jgi:hypothetical protein
LWRSYSNIIFIVGRSRYAHLADTTEENAFANTLSHGQRRRLPLARFATCFTQRLSPGQRLWLFAWQRQKAVVSVSVAFAGFDTNLCSTTQVCL